MAALPNALRPVNAFGDRYRQLAASASTGQGGLTGKVTSGHGWSWSAVPGSGHQRAEPRPRHVALSAYRPVVDYDDGRAERLFEAGSGVVRVLRAPGTMPLDVVDRIAAGLVALVERARSSHSRLPGATREDVPAVDAVPAFDVVAAMPAFDVVRT